MSRSVGAEEAPMEPDQIILPRPLLWGAFALVILTISTIAVAVHRGRPDPLAAAAGSPPVRVRDLRFEDGADGSVVIRDPASGAVLESLPPGGSGFVRGVLRGLARERGLRGLGPQVPMRLTGWGNGSLTLQDLATGEAIEVNSFGPTNAAAFREILLHAR